MEHDHGINTEGLNSITNHQLIVELEERIKRAEAIMNSNIEIEEKEKCSAELITASKKLISQYAEKKESTGKEIPIVNNQLKRSTQNLEERISDLEKLMVITSHRVRQPIANILGIAKLLDRSIDSQEDLNKLVYYMKQSAISLESFTWELTSRMNDMIQKDKMDLHKKLHN